MTPVLLSINVINMMKRIESRDNPTFKGIADLRQARHSREDRLIFLEGARLCQDALLSGASPVFALFSDTGESSPMIAGLRALLPADATVISLPDRLFNMLCDTQQPQGIALVCQSPLIEKPIGPPAAMGLYLIAEGIQDPGNLGTMIRTADAFAFDGVILTEGTVYPFNDKVLRAAMGSCFHIPLLEMQDISIIMAWLNQNPTGCSLLAADMDGQASLPDDLPLPAALIIGNEGRGISGQARQFCTWRISIPMPGRAESLNAAAAAAILSHDLMLKRFTLQGKVL